jgi:hypothetical protein
MNDAAQATGLEANQGQETVEIAVNFNRVVMNTRKATGLQIKTAAISQGVNIKSDFILYEINDGKRRNRIGDDKQVELHPGEKFEAVPDDDNS